MATCGLQVSGAKNLFLSTPPSRVAPHARAGPQTADRVSIHATLAGGDSVRFFEDERAYVSIHATLAGGDLRNW